MFISSVHFLIMQEYLYAIERRRGEFLIIVVPNSDLTLPAFSLFFIFYLGRIVFLYSVADICIVTVCETDAKHVTILICVAYINNERKMFGHFLSFFLI